MDDLPTVFCILLSYKMTSLPPLPATGQTLRCDVFVDTISRIAITTRTRELLLEEEPERFEVQAFDDEGEQFVSSTVDLPIHSCL